MLKIKKICFCFLILVGATPLLAQKSNPAMAARQQINDLKQGTLVVRLRTQQFKIDALNTIDRPQTAKKITQQQRQINLQLVQDFKNNYTFSNQKTVFFYSTQTNDFKANNWQNLFLNDSLEADPNIKIDTSKPIFVAEIAPIESQNQSLGITALLIMDRNLMQLKPPFPFYVRPIDKIAYNNTRRKTGDVGILNKKLEKFYARPL